jgi:type IV secretory pathway TrbL component
VSKVYSDSPNLLVSLTVSQIGSPAVLEFGTAMSTCDRVTKLYDMLQAGAISAQEYTALKQEAFAHAAASTTAPQVGNASDFAKIQEQMDDVQQAVRAIASGLKRSSETTACAESD